MADKRVKMGGSQEDFDSIQRKLTRVNKPYEKIRDKSDPNYLSTNRDVTKRGLSPFSQEAMEPVRRHQKVLGNVGELYDDQYKEMSDDRKRVLQKKSDDEIKRVTDKPATIDGSFKKGGKVKKTGVYKVHKGERVLTVKQAKKVEGKKTGSKSSKVGKSAKSSGMSKLMQSPPTCMKGLTPKKYGAKKQYGK